jgi:hypothetical protein
MQQNLFWTETEGVVFKKFVAAQKQQGSFVSFDLFESRKVSEGREGETEGSGEIGLCAAPVCRLS